MPTVTPPSVGTPGSVATASGLNDSIAAFDGVTLDGDTNIRVDGLHGRHISIISTNAAVGAAKNTDDTTTTYTGTSYVDITHGSDPLLESPGILLDGQTLRVHWHQYVDSVDNGASDVDDFATFRLLWDIGAGYVVPTDAPSLGWSVSGYQQNSVGVLDQRATHNMTGSYIYKNTTGSAINVAHIKLQVKPSELHVGGNIDLGEGTLVWIIQGMS